MGGSFDSRDREWIALRARKVEIGPLEGEMRVIDKGISADDRVLIAGIMRAIPGQKVDPRMKAAEATPPPAAAK